MNSHLINEVTTFTVRRDTLAARNLKYLLRSRGHQFSLPQLNTVLYKNVFGNRRLFVFSVFSSIIPLCCVVFFLLCYFFHCIVFFSSLFVLKVRMSSLFIRGYSNVAEWLACWTQAQKGLGSNRTRSLRQTVHTHCASVHQAAKLVAALLRVAGVTAGLTESNGSLPPGL